MSASLDYSFIENLEVQDPCFLWKYGILILVEQGCLRAFGNGKGQKMLNLFNM